MMTARMTARGISGIDDEDSNNDNDEDDESVVDNDEEDELDAELDLESQDNKDVIILYRFVLLKNN